MLVFITSCDAEVAGRPREISAPGVSQTRVHLFSEKYTGLCKPIKRRCKARWVGWETQLEGSRPYQKIYASLHSFYASLHRFFEKQESAFDGSDSPKNKRLITWLVGLPTCECPHRRSGTSTTHFTRVYASLHSFMQACIHFFSTRSVATTQSNLRLFFVGDTQDCTSR